MERDKELREEQKEVQQQPGNLSSFNNRNPRKSTEAEDAGEADRRSNNKAGKKTARGKKKT